MESKQKRAVSTFWVSWGGLGGGGAVLGGGGETQRGRWSLCDRMKEKNLKNNSWIGRISGGGKNAATCCLALSGRFSCVPLRLTSFSHAVFLRLRTEKKSSNYNICFVYFFVYPTTECSSSLMLIWGCLHSAVIMSTSDPVGCLLELDWTSCFALVSLTKQKNRKAGSAFRCQTLIQLTVKIFI